VPGVLSGFLAGLLFGVGLTVSGMIDPARVTGFLDVTGAWDPSLAFVMAGAVAVTMAGYRAVFARRRPLFDSQFALPTRRDVDARLVVGAVLFGAGWGLAGFCPGPAITVLPLGAWQPFVFVAAMAIGMVAARLIGRLGDPSRSGRRAAHPAGRQPGGNQA